MWFSHLKHALNSRERKDSSFSTDTLKLISKSLQNAFSRQSTRGLPAPSGLWRSKTLGQFSLSCQKAVYLHSQCVFCILPLQPGWALWVTDSTSGHSTSRHCREPRNTPAQSSASAWQRFELHRTVWMSHRFDDSNLGLGWSKPSRTFGSQRWGNFPHTKHKGSLSLLRTANSP